jgi:hypothetical protein
MDKVTVITITIRYLLGLEIAYLLGPLLFAQPHATTPVID